ncbi:MAG TPA: ABC transporter permease subunit [Bacillota bacterium]|nr:ABC transporter permease subunit [Bacillota bacterium]
MQKIKKLIHSKTTHQGLFLVSIFGIWEVLARTGNLPALLVPAFSDVLQVFIAQLTKGELLNRTLFSLYLISYGLGIAIILAFFVTSLAVCLPLIADWVQVLMAIMHPLPGIAILPIIILWLGTGAQSIIAVILISSIWPVMANLNIGLRSIPSMQVEAARNLGLHGLQLVWSIMLPSSFPHILSGLRIGWARAWQAAIAAEMVFGACGGEGGLGWFIYKKRFFMEIPEVFAGMAVIVLIGIIIERGFFEGIEQRTIRRWGMTTHV